MRLRAGSEWKATVKSIENVLCCSVALLFSWRAVLNSFAGLLFRTGREIILEPGFSVFLSVYSFFPPLDLNYCFPIMK